MAADEVAVEAAMAAVSAAVTVDPVVGVTVVAVGCGVFTVLYEAVNLVEERFCGWEIR